MRAILSYPYAGAIYWWFASAGGQQPPRYVGSQADQHTGHPYYRTLYGQVDENIDVALAALIIFDEVVLPAADTPIAGSNLKNERFFEPQFGIEGDWTFTHEARKLIEPTQEDLVRDHELAKILRRVPSRMRPLILETAATDMLLMQAYEAPAICRPGRAAVIDRLLKLGVLPSSSLLAAKIEQMGALDKAARDYVDVTGLTFRADGIESLSIIKWDSTIRSYAHKFQSVLTRLEDSDGDLWVAIAEARRSSDASKDISGYFTATSRTFSLASLVPGLGLISGPAAIVSDWASVAANRRAETARWYELSSLIAQRRTSIALDAELKFRGL